MFYFTGSQVLTAIKGVHQEVLSSLPRTEESFIVLLLQKNYAQLYYVRRAINSFRDSTDVILRGSKHFLSL